MRVRAVIAVLAVAFEGAAVASGPQTSQPRAETFSAGATAVLVALVAGYLYLNYVLVLFPWTRALGRSLTSILLQPLKTLATGFLAFIPDLVFLIILALITRWALRLVRLFFARVATGESRRSGSFGSG